jgi:hypothetical protein
MNARDFKTQARALLEEAGIAIDEDAFKKAIQRVKRHCNAMYGPGASNWGDDDGSARQIFHFYTEVLEGDNATFNRKRAGLA